MGLLATGFVLGLAFCAAPGAVTAEAVRRGAARGWPAALALGAGSVLGDALWAGAGLAGAASVARGGLAQALGAAGVGLLLYLAWQAARDARRPGLRAAEGAGGGPGSPRSTGGLGGFLAPGLRRARAGGDVAVGAALSLTNPLAVAYWLAAGGAVAARAPADSSVAVVFAGAMTAAVVWCVVLAAAVAWTRRWMSGRVLRVLSALSALLLLVAVVRLALGLLG